jgi:phage repressor protein C with HTH and peptisase S24 domain
MVGVLTKVRARDNKKSCIADLNQSCHGLGVFRSDRLEALIARSGLSQSEVARRVGVSPTSIWKLIREPSQGSKHIHRIAAVLGTTPEYLMDETDDDGASSVGAPRLSFHPAPAERDPDLVELEQVDLRYGMGGTYLDAPIEANKRAFSRALLRHLTPVAPEHLFWALGDGDSMEPTIRSGELILIDRSQQTPRMGDGIWAVAWGEIGMIKRLRPLPDGSVEIHSDNPLIPPARAVDGELHVIGRVVAVVRRL